MLTDPGSGAADREARNEYLIDIDEAWEVFRDAVERARSAYDEALDACGAAYVRQQEDAASAHHHALDLAWATYKQDVADRRADRRTAARATYNAAAAICRRSYEEAMQAARGDYASAVQAARLAYEAEFDEAFAVHRQAIRSVPKFLEPAGDDAEHRVGNLDIYELELAVVTTAAMDAGADPVPPPPGGRSDDPEATLDVEQQAEEVATGTAEDSREERRDLEG